MAETFQFVKGMSQLVKFFDELPAKLQRNALRGTLRAGAVVLEGYVLPNIPVGRPSFKNASAKYGGYLGALRDSLHVSTRNVNGAPVASVIAGGKTKGGAIVWYARMLEFTGAAPHEIKPSTKKALRIGGALVHSVMHPGFKAHPFMRPGMDQGAVPAATAAAEYLRNRLAKQDGLEAAADIQIGDSA